MKKCSECGGIVKTGGVPIGDGKLHCDDCALRLENTPDQCPVCGADLGPDGVAMLLTKATATPEERLGAHSALVNVCSMCGVLYMDGYQRKLLELLRKD